MPPCCRSEVVDKRWYHRCTSDVPPLLILRLHLSASHLLLKLSLQKVDFELKLLFLLLAAGLILSTHVCSLLQLFFVLSLQRSDLVIFRLDRLSHQLLLLHCIFRLLLGNFCGALRLSLLRFSFLDLVFKVEALVLPLGEHPLNLLLDRSLLVLDLLANLLKLLLGLLVRSFKLLLLTIMLVSDLADTLLVLEASLHQLLSQIVDFILVRAPCGEHFALGLGNQFTLLG